MMVIRRRTGWEQYANRPVQFFEEVLQYQITSYHKAWLNAIADGRRTKLGLLWNTESTGFMDEATLACGICLWRAMTQHKATILWGGRRSIANAWLDHLVLILQASRPDFRHDFRLIRESSMHGLCGLLTPSGTWVLRYDGGLPGDAQRGLHAVGSCADVLIGDFSWVDKSEVKLAINYTNETKSLLTVVIGQDVSR